MIHEILSYVEADDVRRCSNVSRSFRAECFHDDLWRPLCLRLWKGKLNVPQSDVELSKNFGIFDRAILSEKGLTTLSLKELRLVLSRRGVQGWSAFIEKSEYQRAVADSAPTAVNGTSRPIDDKFFASYFYSLHDSRRKRITKAELVRMDWVVHFRSQLYSTHAKFLPNKVLEVNPPIPGAGEYKWRLETSENVAGEFERVAVDQFPPHGFSRDPRYWGWSCENQWVTIAQEHSEVDLRFKSRSAPDDVDDSDEEMA